MMETINIEVSSNVAEAYRNFAVNQRQQIEGLINGLLSQLIQERSLDDVAKPCQPPPIIITSYSFFGWGSFQAKSQF